MTSDGDETRDAGFPDAATGAAHIGADERERLRAVLAFPAPTEVADFSNRQTPASAPAAPAPPVPAPDPTTGDAGSGADVDARLGQLVARVDGLAVLVESLFDRVERSVEASAPLTAEELSDIAARMVRLIEVRLESHSDRLEQMVSTLSDRPVNQIVTEDGTVDVSVIDDHMAMIGRALIDMKKSMQELEHTPDEVQELAILAHFDRWFEETNSRQANDVEHLRRDLHRFDTALIEMQARVAELPDREALRDLSSSLTQMTRESDVAALREAIGELPRQVAIEQPVARLDASIIEQLVAKLEEASEGLAAKVDEQLAARVQRFEALSQAMMTLVGDPVDALAERLNQVIRRLDALDAPKNPK